MSSISVYKTSPPTSFLTVSLFSLLIQDFSFLIPSLCSSHTHLCLEALRRWMILGTPKATVPRLPPLPKAFTSILLTLHMSPTTPWTLSLPRNTPPLRAGLPNLWLWLSVYLLPHFLILLGSALHSWVVLSSVQSLSRVRLFATPWTAAHQISLSITNSWSLLKLMSIKSVMPSNHLIFCHPLLLPPSVFPSIRVFSKESVLSIRWPKYGSFSISPSHEYFRTDFL